jgi:hypothetical protein
VEWKVEAEILGFHEAKAEAEAEAENQPSEAVNKAVFPLRGPLDSGHLPTLIMTDS